MNSAVTAPAGPPRAPNTPAKPNRKLRFSLKTVLVVTAMVAAAFGFIVQQLRLADLQAALWRYEATQIPTSLGANEFRVIERVIIDTSHVKVVTYRIESTAKHFASIQGRGAATAAVRCTIPTRTTMSVKRQSCSIISIRSTMSK